MIHHTTFFLAEHYEWRLGKDQGKVRLWSGGQVKVNFQDFSELDIGGRETCKHNFENSDIFWRKSFYIKIVEFYQEMQNFCRRLSMLWDKLHEKFFFFIFMQHFSLEF